MRPSSLPEEARRRRRHPTSTNALSLSELCDGISASTYMRTRPPLWMLKNRALFRLVRRLVQRVRQECV